MRFVLLIPMLALALQADPVTVVETKSAVGVTDLFSSYSVPASPGPVTALINGDASCYNNLACGDQPATATIDLTMDLYTPGPVRDGVALVQLYITQGGEPEGNGAVSGAIGSYSLGSCASELDCILEGYFPFELGVPFTIDLSGIANGPPPLGGAQFVASASLQLFELPAQAGDPAGAAVQIYLVPEPGSAGLAFTGLSALMLFAVRRKRNLPSI